MTEAYTLLSDPHARRTYDATLFREEWRPPPEAHRSWGEKKHDGERKGGAWYAHHYGKGNVEVEYKFTEEDKKVRMSEIFDGDSAQTQHHADYFKRKKLHQGIPDEFTTKKKGTTKGATAAGVSVKKEDEPSCVVA